jgi:glycosyltransferase involved in cell wall biosynthesis
MDILYLTQTLPPEPGPTRRPLRQAEALQELGHRVTILASMPSYPFGRTFRGYRWRLFYREEMEGVNVIRVWSLPAKNQGVFRRSLSFASFAIGALMTGLGFRRFDLIVASVPNPLTGLAGLLLGRVRRIPVLLELRDLLPDALLAIGYDPRSVVFRLLARYFRWIYFQVDLIVVPGVKMAEGLAARGVPGERILLLPHAADPELLSSDQGQGIRDKYGLNGKFVALYAGSFSSSYGVPGLIRAAGVLEDRLSEFRLLLVGAGPDRARTARLIRDQGLTNVVLADPVEPAEVRHYLQASDMFLAPYGVLSRCYHDYLYTKACEYLTVGRPIVAIEPKPALGNILEEIGAGSRVTPGDTEALVAAITHFASDPQAARRCGENARRYASAHLSRKNVVGAFEAELRRKMARLISRTPCWSAGQ